MPFLRVNRDKRGYENTVVVHSDRRKGRSQRILYLFRTPPGVKIGRAALDDEAIRLIEQHNPGVQFDWTRILEGERRPGKEAAPAQPRAPQRPRREDRPPPAPAPELTPAGARLGPAGLARLRGRYADLLAKINERIEEPGRQAELKAAAERLNPDGWATDADVVAGLDDYEATFESLRGALGPRRRL